MWHNASYCQDCMCADDALSRVLKLVSEGKWGLSMVLAAAHVKSTHLFIFAWLEPPTSAINFIVANEIDCGSWGFNQAIFI